MADPQRAKTIAELRALSDEELVEQHDMLTTTTAVGTGYYLDEIRRREIAKQGRQRLVLTWVIAGLTMVNVAAVIVISLSA